MDYTDAPLFWKLRKVVRYAGLYGVGRTLSKVQGQFHMKRRFTSLPEVTKPGNPNSHVGIIGCGNFAFTTIAYFLKKNFGCVIRGVMDSNIHRAASLCLKYAASYYSDDARRIIGDPKIDLVYIASNHASHAEYAIQAIESGKAVHIEKPHVVSEEQLFRLCKAMKISPQPVRLGYNRPSSHLGGAIRKALGSQSGPLMMNWFIAGHELDPDHWYFSEKEGGRVLGNLCHWIEFVYQMVDPRERYPIEIRPTRSKKSDSDIAVSYAFGDGSVAVISFSAKGHTFEGVKERLSAHKGDVLISMDDFQMLTIEEKDRKKRISLWSRDHGHEASVTKSYGMVRPPKNCSMDTPISYVWEVGDLIVKTKQALDTDARITLTGYDETKLF